MIITFITSILAFLALKFTQRPYQLLALISIIGLFVFIMKSPKQTYYDTADEDTELPVQARKLSFQKQVKNEAKEEIEFEPIEVVESDH